MNHFKIYFLLCYLWTAVWLLMLSSIHLFCTMLLISWSISFLFYYLFDCKFQVYNVFIELHCYCQLDVFHLLIPYFVPIFCQIPFTLFQVNLLFFRQQLPSLQMVYFKIGKFSPRNKVKVTKLKLQSQSLCLSFAKRIYRWNIHNDKPF